MTNSEQAIREFAKEYIGFYSTNGNWCPFITGYENLTALIEEHYYPKEFLLWLLNGYTFLKSDQSFVVNYPYMTEHNDYRHFTCDELYQYWKENER